MLSPYAPTEPWNIGAMQDTCDLYARSRTINNGVPSPEGWELIASGVPYYHRSTDNIWQQTPLGGTIEPSILVTEHGYFPESVPLTGTLGETRAFMLRNTTPDSPKNGWYAVLGPATSQPTYPGTPFNAGRQTVMLRQVDFVPRVDDAPLTAGSLTPGTSSYTTVPLSWLPAVDGVGPYLYTVRQRLTGVLDWSPLVTQTGLAYTVTGLSPGVTYDFEILATDQLGQTAQSTVVTVTTVAVLQAGTLSATGSTFSSVSLAWTAGQNGVAPLAYQPQYRLQGSGTWTSFGSPLSGLSVTITGLLSSQTYEFQVVVTDSAAASAVTNTVSRATGAGLAGYAGYTMDLDPISGQLWQDAAGTIPVTAAGQNVARLQGVSPNGYVVSQSISGSQPTWQSRTNGGVTFPVLRFDGVDDSLAGTTVTLNQPSTVYVVLFPALGSLNATSYVFDGGPAGVNRNAVFIESGGIVHMYAGADLATGYTYPSTGIILACVFNGSSSVLYANGVQIASGSAGTAAFDLITIGNRFSGAVYYTGDIARVPVYNAAHSSSDVTGVTRILGTLYGITVP